jgi:hypothetical protein
MSNERKPQAPTDEAREEKSTMSQPQEEFVGDEAQPSKDISEVQGGATDVKPAGRQEGKPEGQSFEPGAEG